MSQIFNKNFMELREILKAVIDFILKNGSSLFFVIINALITLLFIFRLEKYKSKLSQITLEHQIKFSHYYSERAKIINIVFSKIFDLEQSLKRVMNSCTEDDFEKYQNILEEPTKQLNELKSIVNQNRIYFSEDICSELDGLLEKIRQTLGLYSSTPNLNKDYKLQQIKDLKLKVYNEIQDNIDVNLPNIKKKIEKEFRVLLGVEETK